MASGVAARLPIQWDGLSVRSAVLLALLAYLASAASTTELASSLLTLHPAHFREAVDSGIEPTTSAWLRLARYPLQSSPIATPTSIAQ